MHNAAKYHGAETSTRYEMPGGHAVMVSSRVSTTTLRRFRSASPCHEKEVPARQHGLQQITQQGDSTAGVLMRMTRGKIQGARHTGAHEGSHPEGARR